MAITNVSKTSTSITNIAQPGRGTSWNDDLNAWEDEEMTWDETGEIMDNVSKPSTSITNSNKPS